jgi:4-amino-4-deoxy-L-arabinose transferase-like glycosyltransferase
VVLLLACYFLFFFRIGARDLWPPDEPRYAQVAREMLEEDDWVVPHLNGEVYSEKPPLYFWLVALISKPFGDVNEATARIPAASAATLMVLLTYLLGASMVGAREAFWGALIVATSAQFVWMGRHGVMDSLMAFCILVALGCFYIGYDKRRPVLYIVGFLPLAPAALTKGPVGIAVPVVVMTSFLLADVFLRKEGSMRQLAWFGVSVVAGLAIIAVLVAPWWRAAYEQSNGSYGSLSLLMKQTEGRMLDSYSHYQPFYYYFTNILWQLLPWVVFFPLAALEIVRKGNLRENSGLRFVVVWFLSVFLFFTFISGKRSQYILPLFPAGGLMLGWALLRAEPDKGRLKDESRFSLPLLVIGLLSVAGLLALASGAHEYVREQFPMVLAGILVAAAILTILAAQCARRPPRIALACVLIVTTLVTAVLFGYLAPLANPLASGRAFCNEVLAAMKEGDRLFFFKKYRYNIHYYMRRHVPELKSNEEVLKALEGSTRIFLVADEGRERSLKLGPAYKVEQVARAKVGERETVCLVIQQAGTIPKPNDIR